MKKGQIFFKFFFQITRFKVGISRNTSSFAQISPKQAFKYTIFFNIQKWPNHSISGKLFQKRPNGNPVMDRHQR